MNEIISVKNVSKVYDILKKEPGLLGSLKTLVSRKYEKKIGVDNINFSINEGDFIGFIGPNGAGKTTTIKMLSGIIHPSSGDIKVMGFTPKKLQNSFKRQFAITMGQKNQLWWDIPPLDSFQLLKEIYEISEEDYNQILEEFSLNFKIVKTGKQVLEEYQNDYYDMVLMDIMLPDLDGFETAQKIRETNTYIPIVAFTSLEYEEIEHKLSQSGINHYIKKPSNASELRTLLKSYFTLAA